MKIQVTHYYIDHDEVDNQISTTFTNPFKVIAYIYRLVKEVYKIEVKLIK